jgi:hypothetical protein
VKRPWVLGVDFGGPVRARDQARKIIALAAEALGPGRYRIRSDGFNARLLTGARPGFGAAELAEALVTAELAPRVIGFDFPFSLPVRLLQDAEFAALAGAGAAFLDWSSFNAFVAARLPLTDPLDLSPFAAWRDVRFWIGRDTDRAVRGQPPLKHRFQVTFNMTLLGNALLARLRQSGRYAILPFDSPGERSRVAEVYPGQLMRQLKIPGYKSTPIPAVAAVLEKLASLGIALQLDAGVRAFCEGYDTGRAPHHDFDGADALAALALSIALDLDLARPQTTGARVDAVGEGATYGLP